MTHRREFLGAAVAGAVTAAATSVRAASANDTVNVAVLGSGRGRSLAHRFASLPDCQVAVICDVDESRGKPLAAAIEPVQGRRPEYVVDFRTLLERPDIDALVVATPDHWHAPITIAACLAGKDVYVEKPCSHNVREGRLAVEAARKQKRVVQH